AAERHILTSVCDDPAQCDFISPAIYRNDNLTIAVGSDSRDVKRSIRVRNRIKELIENDTLQID
ncbi:bifunctional precorrin-2 dehydrogenase/sirohydrochlorin ferrochelatase, partial [Pseudomonas donghuensis]|nr:bifunctional precorrin-2 dehydrogenase/sirohydrochlorin ferrochelatase [Pseudomonas donghuensis]